MEFWRIGFTLAEVEKRAIIEAYEHFQKNKTRTAKALDIAIRTLDSKLEQYASPQSLNKIPEKPAVPMPERQEIQKMPSPIIAKNDTNQRGATEKCYSKTKR
jgi:hypothetical protein